MATVYLHIGLHKTGTTALQYFLEDNKEVLKQHGICFPDFGFRYKLIDFRRNGHFLVVPWCNEETGETTFDRPCSDYEPTLDKIRKLGETYDKILLSDEGIWRSSHHRKDFWPGLKEDLKKRGLDLKIIVYLRRQDLWIQSFWKQKVRGGTTNTLPQHVERMKNSRTYPIDYCGYMDMLSGIFGKEALIIRIYEKGQYQGPEHTIHSDFLDIFGLTLSDGFTLNQEHYNPSLEGNYLELRRMFNMIPDFYPHDKILKKAINEAQALDDRKDYHQYTWFAPGEQEAFLDLYTESNSRLAKEYLGREDGVLFHDKIKEQPQWITDDGQLLRDAIQVFGRALILLEQENKELRKENRKFREKYAKDMEDLRKNMLFYRLKRKIRHLLGKDKTKA